MDTSGREASMDSGNMPIITSKQIDYSQKALSHAQYKYEPQYPNTYGQTIALNSSQQPVIVQLPPEVFNLYESVVMFTITLPNPGAGNYIWTYEDVGSGSIAHIQHYCASNQWIVDLDNAQNYLKVVYKKETALQDFLSNDELTGIYASNSLNNVIPALRNTPTPLAGQIPVLLITQSQL